VTVRDTGAPDSRRWLALAVILVAMTLDLIDTTIVNVALPQIERDLGASESALQWIVAGYTLAFALSLITAGRVGDIVGRKRMFIVGVAAFVVFSALCGAASGIEMLVVFRVLQGVSSAIVMTQGLSLFQVMFPPRERAAVFGMFGALTGLAAVLGPVAGGLLINWNLAGLHWRPIFLINVPIGIAALILAAMWVSESKAPKAQRLDLVGVVLVTLALVAMLYPLVQGHELGWPLWTYLSMVASIPLLVAFAAYERAKDRRDGSPLVAPSLFTRRAYVGGLLVLLIFFASVGGFFFPLTLYLQVGEHFSALAAGLTIVPFSIGAGATSAFSTQLAVRHGRKVLSTGMLVMALGIGILMLTIKLADHPNGWQFAPGLVVAGLGMGFVIAPMVDIILAGVPTEHAGSASGTLNTADQLGAASGVAVVGTVFFGLLDGSSFASATLGAFWLEIGLLVLGFLVTFLLPKQPRHSEPAAPEPGVARAAM
jgi:EmrB/QacA subfamily drug resistance transporter